MPTFTLITATQKLTNVKPFNLAALKVDNFRCKIIVVSFILANSNKTISTHHTTAMKVSIFTPFTFTVLFSSRNSQNKGHANIKGSTVNVDRQIDMHTDIQIDRQTDRSRYSVCSNRWLSQAITAVRPRNANTITVPCNNQGKIQRRT